MISNKKIFLYFLGCADDMPADISDILVGDACASSHHYMYVCMYGWIDGWMDGWTEGWIDGWMDGWMDGYTHM